MLGPFDDLLHVILERLELHLRPMRLLLVAVEVPFPPFPSLPLHKIYCLTQHMLLEA